MAGIGTVAGTALRSETDYLRRQNNLSIRKQKKLRTIKIKGIHLLFILTMLFFIAFSIFKTGEFILSWDKLSVRYFQVTGSAAAGFIDPQGAANSSNTVANSTWLQANKLLNRYKGSNILALNLDLLRSELSGIPEIKDASISRILPATLAVQFTLREPVFQVEIAPEGKYNIIDKEGVVLYRGAEMKEGLITVKNTRDKYVEKILPYFSRLEEIKDYIEYAGFDEPQGLLLKLKEVNEIFYPGDIDFAKKIAYYLKLRKKLALENTLIKSVDLRFQDRIYLEYEEPLASLESQQAEEPGQQQVKQMQQTSRLTQSQEEVME
jgi:cell division septal protein FtsQ